MNKALINRYVLLTVIFALFCSCESDTAGEPVVPAENSFITAVDISSYPEIASTNPVFYNLQGHPEPFLKILKDNGVQTVRVKLWVDPVNEHAGFEEVHAFSQTLKSEGFKVWLTLHYSDTWADPGQQQTPSRWAGLPFSQLRDSVYDYTTRVMTAMNPDYIQIGNEINAGMLHPQGAITDNAAPLKRLLQAGSEAVRAHSATCKIILHVAGTADAPWFFNQVRDVDYDIIGLSYYPKWHGKSLTELKTVMQQLQLTHQKQVLIAETAYPFTLGWNDYTNNIVGLTEHLILPQYPASPQGQYQFIQDIKTMVHSLPSGAGFCYWGAELIAWKGDQATDGSPWENQALFNFNNEALPVLRAFNQP